MNKSEKNAE